MATHKKIALGCCIHIAFTILLLTIWLAIYGMFIHYSEPEYREQKPTSAVMYQKYIATVRIS